jgi:glycosyltransferase involved in cell wall biosynthesis
MVRGAVVAKRVAFAIPGDLATWTGGYVYDRRIIAELRRLNWAVDVIPLGDGFPTPSKEQIEAASRRLLADRSDRPIVIDGLALGVLPKAAAALHSARPVVALVHHPLAYETGLARSMARRLRDSERSALAATHIVIATSDATAALLTDRFDVSRDRLRVVQPGTDRAPYSIGSGGRRLQLLSVGAIVPRKGFDVLVEALIKATDLSWQLTIVGDRSRDREAVERLEALIARGRLGDRIQSTGKVSSECLATHYARADLFVLASHFEGYGMAYAEAIAHGLPIVGTTGGAIPQTVPSSASRLVPPGNVDALAKALREVMESEAALRALAAGARAAAAALPSWAQCGQEFARALDELR